MPKYDIQLNKLKSCSTSLLPGTKDTVDLIERLKKIAQQCGGEFDEFDGRLYITLKNSKRWLEFELRNDDVWIYEMSIKDIEEYYKVTDGRNGWIGKEDRKDRERKTADLEVKERKQAIRSMKSHLNKRKMHKETTRIIRDRLREQHSDQIPKPREEPRIGSRAFHQDVSSAYGAIDPTRTCRKCANRGASICPNGGLQVCEYWRKIQHQSGFWPE